MGTTLQRRSALGSPASGLLASAVWGACLALTSSASAQSCQPLIAALSRLDLTQGTELVASGARGHTYKQLFDQCDQQTIFLGQRLPDGRTCEDNNNVAFVRRFPDGTVVFRSKMAVDADGSPASCGPNRSGTDQCQTWLTFDRGSRDQHVNAEEVPFAVIPGDGRGISFQGDTGLRRGDLALIVHNGRCSFGVVGDAGPFFRLGQGSIRAHEDLHNPQCEIEGQHPCLRLRNNRSGRGIGSDVTFILFPRTWPRPLLSQSVVAVTREAVPRWAEAFLSRYGR